MRQDVGEGFITLVDRRKTDNSVVCKRDLNTVRIEDSNIESAFLLDGSHLVERVPEGSGALVGGRRRLWNAQPAAAKLLHNILLA